MYTFDESLHDKTFIGCKELMICNIKPRVLFIIDGSNQTNTFVRYNAQLQDMKSIKIIPNFTISLLLPRSNIF